MSNHNGFKLKLVRLTSYNRRGFTGRQSSLAVQHGRLLPPYISPVSKAFSSHLTKISRPLSTSSIRLKGLSPQSEDPHSTRREAEARIDEATEISLEEYHEVSNAYMDQLVSKLEQLQEARDDVDVEFSAGVLTLAFPPNGTYVINKQPPNKQIWLSSPLSGPKRYDYVVLGEGQHEKEGGGSGEWIYLRDGSSLNDLLLKEVGVDLNTATIE